MASGLDQHEIVVLRNQMDRIAIRERIESDYLHGIDTRAAELVLNVFTEDCQFTVMSGQRRFQGHEAFMAGVSRLNTFLNGSCHNLGNLRVDLNGDLASSQAQVVAFLDFNDPATGRRIVMRGLQYLHEWRREADGWRCYDMTHNQLWQCDGDFIDPGIPVFER